MRKPQSNSLRRYICQKINCHEFFEYFNESCVCEAAAGVMEMQIQGKLCIIIVKYTCDLDDEQHNVSSVNEEWIIVDVSTYYVIRNVGARLWERYIVYSCGYIQMFLVEQLLSIHINLAWRATHPCYWYYAFILTIGRYMANRRWRMAVSTLSILLSSKIWIMV